MKTDLIHQTKVLPVLPEERSLMLLKILLAAQQRGRAIDIIDLHRIMVVVSKAFSGGGINLGYSFQNQNLYGVHDRLLIQDLQILMSFVLVIEEGGGHLLVTNFGSDHIQICDYKTKHFGLSHQELNRIIKTGLDEGFSSIPTATSQWWKAAAAFTVG